MKYFSLVLLVSTLIFGAILNFFSKNIDTAKSPENHSNVPSDSIKQNNVYTDEKNIGLWVTYMDLTVEKSKNPEQKFKTNFENIINTAKKFSVNNIYVHIRPFCDSLYPSKIFPWSHILTGTQGVNPGFDPLEYMVEISHKNNMKFHAWINPLRVKLKNIPSNISNENPYYKKFNSNKYFIADDENICLNPGYTETRNLILEGIKEIVSNYNIDGIHFDDYFYPESTLVKDYAFEENNLNSQNIISWRKNSISSLLNETYSEIKIIKPNVKFGISPPGNIQKCEISGIDIDYLISKKILDYICPQIYWSINYATMPFEKTTNFWKNKFENTDIDLYVGIALYKIGTDLDNKTWRNDSFILCKELDIVKKINCQGIMLYSYGQLDFSKEEIKNLSEKLLN